MESPPQTPISQEAAQPVASPAAAAPIRQAGSPDVPLPLEENIAAVIAYITVVPAVVFLYLDPFKRNRFVRFHAWQHLLLFGVAIVGAIAASILWMLLQLMPFMRVLVFPFTGLIGLAWFFVWLLLVVKAYHHQLFKLPYIGDLAEERMNP